MKIVLLPIVALALGLSLASCLSDEDSSTDPAPLPQLDDLDVLANLADDEADHDAPVSQVEAELLDSTDDVLQCGIVMVRQLLHFRVTRQLGGPPVDSNFVALFDCPESVNEGDVMRLDLQPLLTHPEYYRVIDYPRAEAPVVEDGRPAAGAATVTIDAVVQYADENWPACTNGPLVAPVSMTVQRVLEGKLERTYIQVLYPCPRTLRSHEVKRLTIAPAASDPSRYVVVDDAPRVPEPDAEGPVLSVEILLLESVDGFPECGPAPVRAALAAEVTWLLEPAPGLPSVFTAVIDCPRRLGDSRTHRVRLQRLGRRGDDDYYRVLD